MALVTKLSVLCDSIKTQLQDAEDSLGVAANCIFYGDQARIPGSPAICVEPDEKKPTLYGAGRMTEVTLSLFVIVYHSEIRNLEVNRRDADILAENVCDLLNADATRGGTLIHCYVTDVQSGYANKTNSVMRATRIQFEATTQERLPNTP